MNTVSFTSTISPQILDWLDTQAKRQKRTRRDILEEALISFKRISMREGFERAAKDKDIIEMAEWGIDDYAQTLSRF
jgi:hypothetical protein